LDANLNTQLASVVAPDHPDNVDFAMQRGVAHFTTLADAVAAGGIDAVIISSPNHAHYDQAAFCIEAGLPALVEKPLTETLDSAARLVDMAKARGTPMLVGHHRTYSPLLEVARGFLTSEQFGEPVSVQGTALFYKPDDYFAAGPWRTRKGGGPILINLIHEIGVMRYLFGEIDSVTAHVSRATRGFEVEDSAAITLAFGNGALGTFLLSDASASSKSWEMTAGENPAYPFFPDQDCYHFAGTVGSLDFPSMHMRSYAQGHPRSWWESFGEGRLEIARLDPLARQLQHFVEVARGRAQPLVSLRDGYLNMVVVEAIVRAAETRREIRVSECLA
jgi:predicted dehydrogenase